MHPPSRRITAEVQSGDPVPALIPVTVILAATGMLTELMRHCLNLISAEVHLPVPVQIVQPIRGARTKSQGHRDRGSGYKEVAKKPWIPNRIVHRV